MEASILSGTAAQGRRERKLTAMKILKRALPIVLAVCLLASLGAVSAIDAGETRTVIGADLTDDQIKTVYKTFGIERGSVKELTVTNQDERQYLSGVISDAQIGTKSISCISIEVLAAGKGMTVNRRTLPTARARCTSARWRLPASWTRRSAWLRRSTSRALQR